MDNVAQKTEQMLPNADCTVHYYNNPSLKNNDISFHWWQNETTSLHMHDFYEFFIITDNRTLHEINGVREELKKGTLYMIRPSDIHKFIEDSERSCVHMNFCVTAKHLKKICDALKVDLEALSKGSALKVTLSLDELEFFIKRARNLNLMLRENPTRANTLICELISQAVTVISGSREEKDEAPQWFITLLEKIHSPENLSASAKDIYALGGFSPPAMIEYFKKYTGLTPNAYLKAYKCESACRLLRSTHLSILEISNILGYDSLSHFNRIFKEFTGVSPAVYRGKSSQNEHS